MLIRRGRARVGACEITDEVFERGRRLEGIVMQDLEKYFRFRFNPARRSFFASFAA